MTQINEEGKKPDKELEELTERLSAPSVLEFKELQAEVERLKKINDDLIAEKESWPRERDEVLEMADGTIKSHLQTIDTLKKQVEELHRIIIKTHQAVKCEPTMQGSLYHLVIPMWKDALDEYATYITDKQI